MSQPVASGAVAGPSHQAAIPGHQDEAPPAVSPTLAGVKRKREPEQDVVPASLSVAASTKPSVIGIRGKPGAVVVVDVDGGCFDSKMAAPRLEIHAPVGVIVRASPRAPLLLPPVVKYFDADGQQVGPDAGLSGAFAFCIPADHGPDSAKPLHEFQDQVVKLCLNHKATGPKGDIMCRNLSQRYVCDRRGDGKQAAWEGAAPLLSARYKSVAAIAAHVDQAEMEQEAARLTRQRDFSDSVRLGFRTFGDDVSTMLTHLAPGDRQLGVLINQRHSMALECERGVAFHGGQERAEYRVRLYDPYRTRTLLEVMVHDPRELQGRTFSQCIGKYAPRDYESNAAPTLDEGAFELLPWPPLEREQALSRARQAVRQDPLVGQDAWLTIPGQEPVRVHVQSGTREPGLLFCTMEQLNHSVLGPYHALDRGRAQGAGLPKALLEAATGWKLIVPCNLLTALE